MKFKSALILLLIVALTTVAVCSCDAEKISGSDYARKYLESIVAFDFSSAYKMIETNTLAKTIDRDTFVNTYTSLVDKLQISEISYQYMDVTDGNRASLFSYALKYKSALCGDITDNYVMEVLKDGRNNWYINWDMSLILPEMELGDSIYSATLVPKRGEIIASAMPVATNEYVTAVSVVTQERTEDELNTIADKLCTLLPDLKKATVTEKIAHPYNGVALVAEYIPADISENVLTKLNEIDGVKAGKSSYTTSRTYPYSSMLAHFLGYVQSPTAGELEELNQPIGEGGWLYNEECQVGKTGLEKKYESELRGSRGKTVYLRSENGTRKRTFYTEEAQDGLDVQLTVDLDLQIWTENLLSTILSEHNLSGSVIVMNPNTGAIQAIASYPSYDLNMFVGGISDTEYKALLAGNSPLYNRALQSQFPPGSTYKIITAAASIEQGTLNMDSVFPYPNEIRGDAWVPTAYGDWDATQPIKRAKVVRRAPVLNMHNAIIHSDNIYFAYAALKLGDERMYNFFKKLGLDEPIDFDLPVSKSQFYNESDKKRTTYMVAASGFGQARVLTTPLQLAATYCAFVNGGDVPVPYMVKGLYQQQDSQYVCIKDCTPKKNWRDNVVSQRTCDELIAAMKDVMDYRKNGTGAKIGDTGSCDVAGKTGTAEIGNDETGRNISWFIGFRTGVDKENARLVLVQLEVPYEFADEMSLAKFTIARELLYLEKEK